VLPQGKRLFYRLNPWQYWRMPKGPQGQKRPADVVGAAVMVAKIATGEAKESVDAPKDEAAVSLGQRGGLKGGKARAKALSPRERSRIAKAAAEKRWGKTRV
jgi:hypothetical protein